jgi:hypothetical protein
MIQQLFCNFMLYVAIGQSLIPTFLFMLYINVDKNTHKPYRMMSDAINLTGDIL